MPSRAASHSRTFQGSQGATNICQTANSLAASIRSTDPPQCRLRLYDGLAPCEPSCEPSATRGLTFAIGWDPARFGGVLALCWMCTDTECRNIASTPSDNSSYGDCASSEVLSSFVDARTSYQTNCLRGAVPLFQAHRTSSKTTRHYQRPGIHPLRPDTMSHLPTENRQFPRDSQPRDILRPGIVLLCSTHSPTPT